MMTVLFYLVSRIFYSALLSIVLAFVITLIVSLCKELWDTVKINPTGFSREDFMFDVFGAIVGMLLVFGYEVI